MVEEKYVRMAPRLGVSTGMKRRKSLVAES
jgi:hypothetical protein